jgi:hypothetical protein
MTEKLSVGRRSGGRLARQALRKSAKSGAVHPGLEGGSTDP